MVLVTILEFEEITAIMEAVGLVVKNSPLTPVNLTATLTLTLAALRLR